MALTFATMLTAVRTRLGNPSTDGFFTDAQIGDLVNEALQAVNAEADWPWTKATTTFNTVAGTATVDPMTATSNTWVKTRALTIDGYNSMREVSLIEIREEPTSVTGVPEMYAVENELIHLRPVPNAVYTVTHDYFKAEPELSGTAEPLMPASWRYSIVEFATYLAAIREGDMSVADRALTAYRDWITRMADHRRRTSGSRRIRVRPGSAL